VKYNIILFLGESQHVGKSGECANIH